MSGPNAALTLPPGDRDDSPSATATTESSSADPIAGRDVGPAAGGGLLPGLTLEIEQLSVTLDELQMALGDLKLGRAQADWPIMQSAAHRIASLSRHVERTITAARSGRSPQAAARQAAE